MTKAHRYSNVERRAARRLFHGLSVALAALFTGPGCGASGGGPPPDHDRATERPPNIVLIVADDLGYADLACFGGANPTPNLDRIAREGMRFTDFYVAQPICSASRAAILTGCYPNRIGIYSALNPDSRHGLAAGEMTIAESLRARGYATAAFGKWHLGHHPPFLPTRHGFDAYFGLPYSNDMIPPYVTQPEFPPLPLIDGEAIVARNPDQRRLTAWYTERAVRFIEQSRDRPFFLYVPHSMPHVPLFASERFEGKTGLGLYADVIAEIDASVGAILEALERAGVADETLVLFTSDNGPWLLFGDHAGSAGPFREGKATTFDGGARVPLVARWPGRVPAGAVCREPSMTIDLLPTFARLAGAEPPAGIDGRDISPLLLGVPGATSPHEALYFYWDDALQAVRSGRWKLHFEHAYSHVDQPGSGGQRGTTTERRIRSSLFDLEADPGETTDVSGAHPDVVERLERLAEQARADLGDSARGIPGTGKRPPGRLPDPAADPS
jgi:arylsulfatase A